MGRNYGIEVIEVLTPCYCTLCIHVYRIICNNFYERVAQRIKYRLIIIEYIIKYVCKIQKSAEGPAAARPFRLCDGGIEGVREDAAS